MHLFVRDYNGNIVEIYPAVDTRDQLKGLQPNGTFTLGKSGYFYTASEVFAKPSADTSLLVSILIAVLSYPFLLNFAYSSCVLVIWYLISKVYFYYDKKATQKFNNSTLKNEKIIN